MSLVFQRGARIGNFRGPGAGAAAGDFYTKLLSFILILYKAPQLYFDFVFSAIRRHSSVPRFRGPTQARAGVCFFFQHRDRDSGSSFIYYIVSTIYSNTDSGEFVCWFACSFVCLSVQVCFFVSLFLCFLQYSDRDSGSSVIYYIYLLFAAGTDPL